jgi:SAM-dependent methyltransferase
MNKTADHYSQQWAAERGYSEFARANPDAIKLNPNRQLLWDQLIDRIRSEASVREVHVYEGACGYGDFAARLFAEPMPANLHYVGVDIHQDVIRLSLPASAKTILWDITKPLPGDRLFDFITCQSAIHHTPDPAATFRTLVEQLKPGGTIAISAYAKKTPMREAIDDALRDMIVPMTYDEALETSRQFTALGRDLQASEGKIVIRQDLPFLGIKAGEYGIQTFIYIHFIKCWHNELWSEDRCDDVNCDWYHPPFAYRYDQSELRQWAADCGLTVSAEASTEAQHYMECVNDPA